MGGGNIISPPYIDRKAGRQYTMQKRRRLEMNGITGNLEGRRGCRLRTEEMEALREECRAQGTTVYGLPRCMIAIYMATRFK